MNDLLLTMTLMVIAVLYFLPTLVAICRNHHNTMAIFVMNLLLGWFFGLGWVIALIWACTAVDPRLARRA